MAFSAPRKSKSKVCMLSTGSRAMSKLGSLAPVTQLLTRTNIFFLHSAFQNKVLILFWGHIECEKIW